MNCPASRVRVCVSAAEKRHAQKPKTITYTCPIRSTFLPGRRSARYAWANSSLLAERHAAICFARTACRLHFPRRRPQEHLAAPCAAQPLACTRLRLLIQGLPSSSPNLSTAIASTYRPGSQALHRTHFDSPDDCYISYVNAPEAWRTDDGSPLPTKKQFANAAYDPLTRTFTGTITWSPTINNGDARWQYRMVFSESLNLILGGESKQFDADGTQRGTHSFPDELTYWRELRPAVRADSADASPYGLTFIQGGRIGLASYHFIHEGEGGSYISYEHAPEQWRLDDGSFPPARKHFKDPQYDSSTRTFTGQIEWAPTSFGGEARWEYTMIFSADMDAIVGGMVKAFKPDGSASRNHKFGTSTSSAFGALSRLFGDNVLVYERHDEAKAEMFSLLLARQNSRGAAAGANNENEQEQQERA